MKEYRTIINGLIKYMVLNNETSKKANEAIEKYEAIARDVDAHFLSLSQYLLTNNEVVRYDFGKVEEIYSQLHIDALPYYREKLEAARLDYQKGESIEKLKTAVIILQDNEKFYNNQVLPFIEKYGIEQLKQVTSDFIKARATLDSDISMAAETLIKDRNNMDFLNSYLYDLMVTGEYVDELKDDYYFIAFDRYVRKTKLNQKLQAFEQEN